MDSSPNDTHGNGSQPSGGTATEDIFSDSGMPESGFNAFLQTIDPEGDRGFFSYAFPISLILFFILNFFVLVSTYGYNSDIEDEENVDPNLLALSKQKGTIPELRLSLSNIEKELADVESNETLDAESKTKQLDDAEEKVNAARDAIYGIELALVSSENKNVLYWFGFVYTILLIIACVGMWLGSQIGTWAFFGTISLYFITDIISLTNISAYAIEPWYIGMMVTRYLLAICLVCYHLFTRIVLKP
ncbi:MAG: hypothetical protein NUW37_01215 [Planctomycetes bacterium]|nr:hypothetical protein [Planctomycetota bacterium]